MNSILTEEKNNVLVVTLNRPEKLNCFNREMALQLHEALDKANSIIVFPSPFPLWLGKEYIFLSSQVTSSTLRKPC